MKEVRKLERSPPIIKRGKQSKSDANMVSMNEYFGQVEVAQES